MAQISVTRALVDLKRFDQRITQALNQGLFSAYTVGEGSQQIVRTAGNAKFQGNAAEAKARINASFQSVTELINNRNAMKAAIVKSNAVTTVQFMERTITVAEAIELRSSISLYQQAISSITLATSRVANEVASLEVKLAATIENILSAALGGSGKGDAAAQKAIADVQNAASRPEVLEKDFAEAQLQKLRDTVASIEAELDVTLSEVNARTMIEVTL